MITNYKREDIKDILDRKIGFYNEQSLIADKLRSIYVAQGWVHMTDSFFKTMSLIEDLTDGVLVVLKENPEKDTSTLASAGVMVEAYFDEEDFLNITYYFILS